MPNTCCHVVEAKWSLSLVLEDRAGDANMHLVHSPLDFYPPYCQEIYILSIPLTSVELSLSSILELGAGKLSEREVAIHTATR